MKKMLLILGFILAVSGASSAWAIDHCEDEEDGRCYWCETGYVTSQDYTSCISIPHCIFGDGGECWVCEDGYISDSSACLEAGPDGCIPNCQRGRCTVDGKCTRCASGAWKKGDSCELYDDPNCQSFNSDGSGCSSCKSGMILEYNGKCRSEAIPVENCAELFRSPVAISMGIQANTGCKVCNDGYILVAGKCVLGSTCPAGYSTQHYEGNTSCVNPNCAGWYSLNGYCSTNGGCKNGKYMMEGDCVDSCPDGYVITHLYQYAVCVPIESGCRSNEVLMGNECVLWSEASCEAGEEMVDGACVLKTRYTMEEADAATSNDNENMIEWVFQ